MAITGLIMILYLIAHLLGNLSIFNGQDSINAYGSILRRIGPLLWLIRLVMLVAFLVHVYYAVLLTIQNREARSVPYRIKKSLSSTFASRNMIWTGLVIALYVIYHLLNFTVPLIHPELSASRNIDITGRPDIFSMVVMNFRIITNNIVYIVAIIALALHLSHGIQSLIQTFGLNSEKTLPLMIRSGGIMSILFLMGFISIPIAVITGLLR